ncbi:MAG: DHH family phosphoesterase [Patescibacteria group bacterium]
MKKEEKETFFSDVADLLSGFLQSLKTLAKKKKSNKVALIMHKMPDPDSIATAFCLKKAFLELFKLESDIFGTGGVSHPQTKTMVNKLDVEIKDDVSFVEQAENYGIVIFCDTGAYNASLQGIVPNLIIDHHKTTDDFPDTLYLYKDFGTASTIVYFWLKELGATITSEMATALAVGISTDTKDLTKEDEVTGFDTRAHQELLALIDYPLFAKISYRYEIPRQLISLMGHGYSSVQFDEFGAFIGLGETRAGQAHYYAIIADLALRVPETSLVVVVGIEDGKAIRASVRSSIGLVQTNDFCKKVFEDGSETDTGRAGAGGRTGSGGAYIPLSTREIEEWEQATSEEREILFTIKMRRYAERIKNALDS